MMTLPQKPTSVPCPSNPPSRHQSGEPRGHENDPSLRQAGSGYSAEVGRADRVLVFGSPI